MLLQEKLVPLTTTRRKFIINETKPGSTRKAFTQIPKIPNEGPNIGEWPSLWSMDG
jgi:hypothetical protein